MLEITPTAQESLYRLNLHVQATLVHLPEHDINIISPRKTEIAVYLKARHVPTHHINITDQIFQNTKCRYFFDQFDFLNDIFITPTASYFTSLRFPRTSQHINNWINGKCSDILLSLIAIHTSLRAYHLKGVYEEVYYNKNHLGNLIDDFDLSS
jgi:hypothetical protein